jgi:hypothetical protein
MEDITHESSPEQAQNQDHSQNLPQVTPAVRTLDEVVAECKEYILKRNASARERVPDAGKPMYLMSKTWLRRYKEYILM